LSTSRTKLAPRAAALAIVVVALLFYLLVPLRTYVAQRNRLGDLERQTQILEQQNAELQDGVDQLRDPAYIEKIARECLAMVRPGEIGFVIVPKEGPPEPPSC
jgi:cell division protein FtsB